MKSNIYKKMSVPCRLLASRLMPAQGREHPEQPATVLSLVIILINPPAVVKRNHNVNHMPRLESIGARSERPDLFPLTDLVGIPDLPFLILSEKPEAVLAEIAGISSAKEVSIRNQEDILFDFQQLTAFI